LPTPRKAKEEARAIRWLRKGKTAAWAAKRVEVHPTTVQRWAKKHGIELEFPYNRNQDRTDLVDNDYIIRLSAERFDDGKRMFTQREIAELAKCSESWVKKVRARARADGLLS
jgi:transposase